MCKHWDHGKAFRSHLRTGLMEFNDPESWVIGLALQQSLRKRDSLQIHRVTKIFIFSVSQAAILRSEHLEPAPVQALPRWMNRSARTLRDASTETQTKWVQGHSGININEAPDRKANLARECCRSGIVSRREYTAVANWTR